MQMKFLFLRKSSILMLLLCIGMLGVSCSDDDNKSSTVGIPFKSVFLEVDNERVEASVVDQKNLFLSFNLAENFEHSKLEIELTDEYELIFPTDVNDADFANYPVLNFRSKSNNQIVKYWLKIVSKAFPIEDDSKISVVGIPGTSISFENKEVVIPFDKKLMNMKNITLEFAEGALIEGATIESELTYDFSKGLSQPLIVKLDGIDRHLTARLNVASALADPRSYGFSIVTNQYIDPKEYPYINVYKASSIIGVPIRNNAPETPWSWDVGPGQVAEYLAFIGDWNSNRAVETVGNLEFAIATIDIEKANSKLVSNNNRNIKLNEVNGLLAMTGIPVGENTMLYWDNKVLNTQNTEWAGWRAAIGFGANGEFSIYNASIDNSGVYRYPYFNDYPGGGYVAQGTPWDVISAACGHPWLVRDGHPLTRIEAYINDGTGWEVALGEAWNGERTRAFMGLTYDNKIGLAVVSTNSLGICQAGWILEKLGWRDVFYVAGSHYNANEFITSLRVNGKIVAGSATQQTQYCIAIDVKN